MRAIWKGAVAFGLVNVPVKLYAATGEHSVPLHQVHREDGGRIRYRKVCSVDGEEVPYEDIAKGYETDDGRMVVLTDEDLDELPLATEREIAVEEFVPSEQVDPIMLGKTYYLEPERTSAKPYALLREALRQADRMAVVKVALRQRESMAVLRARDDVICLQTLLWPDEIREADFPILETDVEVRPQELSMASSLIDSLAADFDPSAFEDRYRGALEALIEAKVSTGRTVRVEHGEEEAAEGGEVVDLLSALQRSVERARDKRTGSGGASAEAAPAKPARGRAASAGTTSAKDGPAKEAPAKTASTRAPSARSSTTKTAATKTAATKTAATKTAATKTAATKTAAAKTTAAKKAPPRTTAAKAEPDAAPKKTTRRRAS